MYNPQKIEKKWQKVWEKAEIYKIPDKDKTRKNFYHLVMFPYPSGDLHLGHWYNFAPADVYARFKKMQGFNVMSPIGFDAFGLPAENAAIKHKIHPKKWTYKNIKTMKRQLKSIGNMYDWSREVITCDPEYYKWTQWMFIQLYKKGLVYRAEVPANFCPSCKTVLANEQVVEGRCERCGNEVIQKKIKQWLFKITNYAERLLKDLKDLDWPKKTKTMQENWIGKSEGFQIKFKIQDSLQRVDSFQAENLQNSTSTFAEAMKDKETTKGKQESKFIEVFTTRADTLFGCTYLVVAPEHEIIENLKSKILNFKSVKDYIEQSKKKNERERISEIKEKTGIELRGIKVINPVNNKEIPIFTADYVLIHYGTGAIMAVPSHDQRDFDFAKRYNLPIIDVIKPLQAANCKLQDNQSYEGEGILINSGRFTGMKSEIAKQRIGEWLARKNLAKKAIYYKLKDWLISRQRYWGCPIPLIFCGNCRKKLMENSKFKIQNSKFNRGELLNPGWISILEKNLPVILPRIKDFRPNKKGQSPLAKSKKFIKASCPKCGQRAQRETDTMDTFVCSSWYYLRYVDSKNKKKFADKVKLKKWLPVDIYIGGAEHTVLHLLYSRFFTKALYDMGYLDFKEPFLKLRHQGIILGPDGQKMSKSRGNIISPDQQVENYGSDALRMYLCFMGPYDQGGPWNPRGIIGIYRFLEKIYKLSQKSKVKSQNYKSKIKSFKIQNNIKLEKLIHQTIKKVTEDIENLRFNTAISTLMILVNEMEKQDQLSIIHYQLLLKLLSPFAPHLSEELWQRQRKAQNAKRKTAIQRSKPFKSIFQEKWPKYNSELTKEEKIILIIQINGRARDKIQVEADISEEQAKEFALSQQKIQDWIAGKDIKKIIFVPKRLINFVVC